MDGGVLKRLGSALTIALLAAVALPAVARAELYWLDNPASSIMRAPEDGGTPEPFLTGVVGNGIGVGVGDQHVYWAPLGAIGRVGLDGSNPNPSFIGGVTGPLGVASAGGHVFWSNQASNTIGRANLDGSAVNQALISLSGTPGGVAADSQHVYWANITGGKIGRADVDGGNVDSNLVTGINNPTFVAIDANHVYWSSLNGNAIGRANLDGSGVDYDFITTTAPNGVAVDAAHIYWVRLGGIASDTIARANLDGTGVDQSLITGVQAQGIAVSWQAMSAAPATLTFGVPAAVPQGTLSAPQTVTYTSTGSEPMQVRRFVLSGPGANDFMTSNDTCRFEVDPGDTCTVQVRFAPGAPGPSSATLTAEGGKSASAAITLNGTAGPLPSGPQGPAGRDAQVTCVIKKKGKKRKKKVKVKVTCKVELTNPGTTSLRWRLSGHGETVASGVARAEHGRVRLGRRAFGRLADGRYVLRIDGRRAATFVVG